MKDPRLARQIVGELPELVSQNIIDAAAADALRRHYEPHIKPSRSLSIGLTISAILGGLLVGAGIILLIAHNWDELSKPMRAVLAMLPLLASAGLSGYAILRRMDSAAWREGCGAFYFLSIGASIALVSQTYHLYNDMEGFLFYWILLSLPVVYLLQSGAAFAGSLAGIVAYAFAVNEIHRGSFSVTTLILLALVLPYYAWHVRRHRESLTVTWISYALAIALPLIGAAYMERLEPIYLCAFLGVLAVVYYLAGCCWFGAHRGFRNPFRSLGSAGVAVLAVILTYSDIYGYFWRHDKMPSVAFGVITGILGCVWIALTAFMAAKKMPFNWAAALFPAALLLALTPALGVAGPFVVNVYVLALGIFTLARGVRRDSLLSMNEGLLLVAVLVTCRFFDSDYGFVARGVTFILVGAGFLTMNVLVMKKRRDKDGARGGKEAAS